MMYERIKMIAEQQRGAFARTRASEKLANGAVTKRRLSNVSVKEMLLKSAKSVA
jgi:hypothetical protein